MTNERFEELIEDVFESSLEEYAMLFEGKTDELYQLAARYGTSFKHEVLRKRNEYLYNSRLENYDYNVDNIIKGIAYDKLLFHELTGPSDSKRDILIEHVREILRLKRKNYNPNENDRFESFRKYAIWRMLRPAEGALFKQDKHTEVIDRWIINNEKVKLEDALEVFGDRIAYDIIILALIEEEVTNNGF